MKSKFYSIGGIVIQFNSEKLIENSVLYKPFITEKRDADIIVNIECSPLPEISGTLLFSSENEDIYETDSGRVYYSYYPVFQGRKCYARHSFSGNIFRLIIDYDKGLWDSMIFFALNFPRLLAQKNSVLCHCSYILYNGEAILFSAPKQSGKSTQADLWKKLKGATVVNGDRAVLKIVNGRLTAFGTPFCGSSKISLNISAPVRAVVFLSKSSNNRNKLELIESKKECFFELIKNVSVNTDYENKIVDTAIKMCSCSDMYRMECLPNETAVELLDDELWK